MRNAHISSVRRSWSPKLRDAKIGTCLFLAWCALHILEMNTPTRLWVTGFFFSWHSLLLQYYLEQTTQILHVSCQTHCPSNRCWWYSSSRVRFRRLTVYLIHRLFFGFSLNRTLAMLAKVCPRSVVLIRLSNIHLLRVLPSLGRFSHQACSFTESPNCTFSVFVWGLLCLCVCLVLSDQLMWTRSDDTAC